MHTFFTALSDRTRRRILNLMREQEICVNLFTEVLEINQPKISRHLAYLRRAEIVTARREGKWMYYRIIKPEDFYAARILRETLDWLKRDARMRKDYDNFMSIQNSTKTSISASGTTQEFILPETNMNFEKRAEIETYLL